jgi:hypothetical protein
MLRAISICDQWRSQCRSSAGGSCCCLPSPAPIPSSSSTSGLGGAGGRGAPAPPPGPTGGSAAACDETPKPPISFVSALVLLNP